MFGQWPQSKILLIIDHDLYTVRCRHRGRHSNFCLNKCFSLNTSASLSKSECYVNCEQGKGLMGKTACVFHFQCERCHGHGEVVGNMNLALLCVCNSSG